MRREFNLQRWLEDKSKKIVTLNGYPVEILKWDAKGTRPIIGIYQISENEDMEKSWTIEGKESTNPNMTSGFDLFFEEEPEMTPFEKELMIDMDYYVHNLYSLGKTEEERIKWIKAWTPRLLEFASKELYTSVESDSSDFYTELAKAFDDAQHHTASDEYVFAKKYKEKFLELARKELEPEFEAELDKAYKNADIVQFNRGMTVVLNNPHIYFHVGDTIRPKNSNAEYTITSIFNGKYYGEGWSLDIIKAADDYELVKRYDQKFKIGDTVCRQYYEDHTIVRIYYTCNDPVYVCKNEEGLESHIPFSDQDEWELKSENKNNDIDYSSEIIGFLKNYINAHGCTSMNSWVKWINKQRMNECGKARKS